MRSAGGDERRKESKEKERVRVYKDVKGAILEDEGLVLLRFWK